MFRSLYVLPVLVAFAPADMAPMSLLARMVEPAAQPPATAAPVIATADSRRPLVIERASDGLFYVEAKVNGAPVQFVVDSGSSVVVLNGMDAARAGVGGEDAVAVDTAGGSAPMRRARIGRVVFAGQTIEGVEAAVVHRNLKVSLLGQSVLSQLGSVTFRGNRLELD